MNGSRSAAVTSSTSRPSSQPRPAAASDDWGNDGEQEEEEEEEEGWGSNDEEGSEENENGEAAGTASAGADSASEDDAADIVEVDATGARWRLDGAGGRRLRPHWHRCADAAGRPLAAVAVPRGYRRTWHGSSAWQQHPPDARPCCCQRLTWNQHLAPAPRCCQLLRAAAV
jgi:hypothetical protein